MLQTHAEMADENATLRANIAVLEARDTSRTHIEDLYAKLVASGILDVDDEEEGEGIGVDGGDEETGADGDSDVDMASSEASDAGEPSEAGEEIENGPAPSDQMNGVASAGQPAAGKERIQGDMNVSDEAMVA